MLEPRPPIVTFLGHVDHGKTTLLDAIRKTSIATREAGGITQSIGASVIKTLEGRKITFIDTPGHAAFTQMRSRGAKACDIAILIVASDDGVKPQTKEAIQMILQENIPYFVCLTKTDLPSSDPDSAIAQLEKEGISFEGKGGNVPYLKVSAKNGSGLKDLLEMIMLLSDVNEIKGDPDGCLEGYVVETRKDRRGSLASVVVTNGTLKTGEEIYIDGIKTKIRGLFNHLDKPIREVRPGEPAMVLGFEKMPEIGAKVVDSLGETDCRKSVKEEPKRRVPDDTKLNLVVRAQSSGCLEALLDNLPPDVKVVSSGVGNVIEADVFTAKSAGGCRIFAYESKVPANISKLADTEGVEIERFDIIYKLFERVDEILKEGAEEIVGKAEIVTSFPYESKKVAGCKVVSGKISKDDSLRVMRGEKLLGAAKAVSMKKEKKNILEAKQGEEFGVILQPQLDFVSGDVLLSVR